jgi:hypothetical protein
MIALLFPNIKPTALGQKAIDPCRDNLHSQIRSKHVLGVGTEVQSCASWGAMNEVFNGEYCGGDCIAVSPTFCNSPRVNGAVGPYTVQALFF